MITSSIESNNLHLKQIESIEVNRVAHIPPRAVWLWLQQKKMHSSLDCVYQDDISGSDTEKRLRMVASSMWELHRRLIPALHNYHTSSLMYWPCCKYFNQGKKPFHVQFSIVDNKKTLQLRRNACSGPAEVVIQTRPHLQQHCIISWWLMLSPPGGPSSMNHMNCLLVALKRRHGNCYCIVPNVFGSVQITEILIVIDVVCEVGKSLETPTNVIL